MREQFFWFILVSVALIIVSVLRIIWIAKKEKKAELNVLLIDDKKAEEMVMHLADILIKYANEHTKRISLLNYSKDQMLTALSIYDKKLLSQIDELKEKREYLSYLSGYINDFADDKIAKVVNHVRNLKLCGLPIDDES